MANLDIGESDFPEITEIWRTGPNVIVVSVNGTSKRPERHVVRITARENIRSGATPGYFAAYEEQVTITDANGTPREVWAETDYPWQDGDTAEDCLKAALIWVSGG
jgi:hypothetical protein